MKKKNLALRMSACMMSALLVVGSAAPAYAAEDMVFADQAADVSEYAGYKTVVDGTEPDVAEPVMTIYNADGSIDKKISDDKSDTALTYAKTGQTVKLDKDATIDSLSFYRDCTFDLNGHVLTLESSLTGGGNCTCRIIDSSSEKTGKIAVEQYFYNGNAENAILILDGITCEVPVVQAISTGKLYVTNGTKVIGAALLNPFMGGGSTYVQDSSWVIAETDLKNDPIDDPLGLIENCTRTSQYTITQTGDRSFTVTSNDLGKAMRAFEALDASSYTKASYAAAKAVYDEIDGSADDDIQGDVIAQKAKELNDAIAKLQAPASEKSITALKSAITATRKLKSTDYTATSFKIYTAAIATAEKVLKGEDLSEAQATAATKALTAAKAKLVKMKTQTITVSVKNSNGVVSKKYGDKAFYLGAKGKGGLIYKSSNTRIATVDSKGKVTFKKLSGNSGIAVSSTGRFTVKKGLKKGTYRVKVKITAGARGNYNAGSKTVTVTVKVK